MVVEWLALLIAGVSVFISILAYNEARKVQRKSDYGKKAAHYYKVYMYKPEFSFHPNRISFITSPVKKGKIIKWIEALDSLSSYIDKDLTSDYKELMNMIHNPNEYHHDAIEAQLEINAKLFTSKCKEKYGEKMDMIYSLK